MCPDDEVLVQIGAQSQQPDGIGIADWITVSTTRVPVPGGCIVMTKEGRAQCVRYDPEAHATDAILGVITGHVTVQRWARPGVPDTSAKT